MPVFPLPIKFVSRSQVELSNRYFEFIAFVRAIAFSKINAGYLLLDSNGVYSYSARLSRDKDALTKNRSSSHRCIPRLDQIPKRVVITWTRTRHWFTVTGADLFRTDKLDDHLVFLSQDTTTTRRTTSARGTARVVQRAALDPEGGNWHSKRRRRGSNSKGNKIKIKLTR